MSTDLTLICNPNSGSAQDGFHEALEAAYRDRGARVTVCQTTPEHGGDALAREALEKGTRLIVAAGGDGTIMAVVNGIAAADAETRENATLGVVPAGTANLVARALGIPLEMEAAVETTLSGRDRSIDLGHCEGKFFALGVGAGITERVISGTTDEEKEKLGRLAYARAMLKEMGAPPHRFSFQLDGGPMQHASGVGLVVANAGEIGHGLQFAPDADLEDGKLDLCIVRRFYLRDVVRLLWKGLSGDLRTDRGVDYFQASEIEISSAPALDIQIDGELVDSQTPLRVQARRRALQVRVPAA